jgi:hypothetical protein
LGVRSAAMISMSRPMSREGVMRGCLALFAATLTLRHCR